MMSVKRGWVMVAVVVALAWSLIGVLVWQNRTESSQIHEHRQRNEMYHQIMCAKQDELAARLGFVTKTKCPPAVDWRNHDFTSE